MLALRVFHLIMHVSHESHEPCDSSRRCGLEKRLPFTERKPLFCGTHIASHHDLITFRPLVSAEIFESPRACLTFQHDGVAPFADLALHTPVQLYL